MIDADRQVPTPTAEAWLIDLAVLGGPKFVVLARSSEEARRRLVEHLREIGAPAAGQQHAAAANVERVSVIW